MLRYLVMPALLVLLAATAACSSLSLEDYAEECGEWREDYDDVSPGSGYSSGSVSDLEDALEDWNALSPPSEVQDFHNLAAESIRLVLELAREGEALEDQLDDLQDELDDARRSQRDDIRDEMDDLRDEQEDLLEDLFDRLEDLGDDYEDVIDDMPRRVERELEDAGCI